MNFGMKSDLSAIHLLTKVELGMNQISFNHSCSKYI